jgi:tRNA (adenine57-N1/adenine58-N1)-methyltransferase
MAKKAQGPRLLVLKQKKAFVEELGREVTTVKEHIFYVHDHSKDYHTQQGIISAVDLAKPAGTVVTSNRGKEFVLLDADFTDRFKHLRRLPQAIPLKDLGAIAAETGINAESIIVDGGAGSGLLACFLARLVKHVTTYELRMEHADVAEENFRTLGLKNVTLKRQSMYDGIGETGADLVTLDLPEPWKVIPHAAKAMKPGAWLVSYSPSVPQMQDFANALQEHGGFLHVKTVELIERLWEAEGRRVRPLTAPIGHSGFLTFARKLC